MKIKSKSSKEDLESYAMSFSPMDLNEDSIRAMVERCFATRGDPKDDLIRSSIIPDNGTFDKVEPAVVLSRTRTVANRQSIRFLLCQLDIVHKGGYEISRFPLFDAKNKYDGTQWAHSVSPIVNLFILSHVLDTKAICLKDKETGETLIGLIDTYLFPTLSPKDPNFPAWWEEHRAEFEEKHLRIKVSYWGIGEDIFYKKYAHWKVAIYPNKLTVQDVLVSKDNGASWETPKKEDLSTLEGAYYTYTVFDEPDAGKNYSALLIRVTENDGKTYNYKYDNETKELSILS